MKAYKGFDKDLKCRSFQYARRRNGPTHGTGGLTMADEKQETIADVVAWLRRPREGENAYLTLWRDEIADRIEAAHKREAGDVAKLREAVEQSKLIAESTSGLRLADDDKLRDIAKVCEIALAAPPRICDVGTAELLPRNWRVKE